VCLPKKKKRRNEEISIVSALELKTSTVSQQAAKGLSINTRFFEIACININTLYIHGRVA